MLLLSQAYRSGEDGLAGFSDEKQQLCFALALWNEQDPILKERLLRDASGRRPVFGGTGKFQTDPHWRDHIPFHEYFHGDNGAGIGASHQTGWSGLVATLIELFGSLDPGRFLERGRKAYFARKEAGRSGQDAK